MNKFIKDGMVAVLISPGFSGNSKRYRISFFAPGAWPPTICRTCSLASSLSLRSSVCKPLRRSACGDFIQEFAEIQTDWQIDEHALVEARIIVTLNRLDVLHFREVTEWVGGAHQLLDGSLTLETLNDENYILNLVAVEHHL